MNHVRRLEELSLDDLPEFGGKNASLGEMLSKLGQAGVRVPGGFALSASAFRQFLEHDHLGERIEEVLSHLDPQDLAALHQAGETIRGWILATPLPAELEAAIAKAYQELSGNEPVPVAVRSSATAEDLPEASFAGQQETYLNIRGLPALLEAVHKVYASLYTDRAIAYRAHQGYAHREVALSVGIQEMVQAEASGVAFTLDTESGFREVVFITATWGLGELLVQGNVNPDEFYVYKPGLRAGQPTILQRRLGSKRHKMVGGSEGLQVVETSPEEQLRLALNDTELLELARQAMAIEEHYGQPMDIEWAKDHRGLYILQARPETVQSRSGRILERYTLLESGPLLLTGRAVGAKIASGTVRILRSPREMERIAPGDILVAEMTDPDWEPVMRRAAAIVTDRGGRTCHAAIVARELGIPAVVGAGEATQLLKEGQEITVSCAEGDTGRIYAGRLRFERRLIELDRMPELPVKIMMNVASPERAFQFAQLPHAGVGLARLEFIIGQTIGIHPQALFELEALEPEVRKEIERKSAGYPSPIDFYREKLVEGISTIAAAFAPHPVIVRLSDFKSNEYAHLLGGSRYEPKEENPMIGFRGASRYRSPAFAQAFSLEIQALRRVREELGFTNVWVMVPFVRTISEAQAVLEILSAQGLKRGQEGLKLIMMCEVPSNAILAEEFLKLFDGFSIGSNDLTQLTLALDRDSGLVAELFDEQDEAVKFLLARAIQAARRLGKYIGICGQGPSDHPELAEWLVAQGIESISLNPDAVLETWLYLAEHIPTS
jgi:pyruvate,water dikinase